MQMLNGTSSTCKSISGMQEVPADFDVVTSGSIDDNILLPNNNSCMVEQSIEREPCSYCPEIFDLLSDLELQPASSQPGDGYSLQTLPEYELLDSCLLGHAARKEKTSPQDNIHRTHEETKDTIKRQSKGKQARGAKQSYLHDKCNTDGVLSKKRCSERRRRRRISAKLSSLRQLLPNSYKRDQASILDEAVKYIQSLELQCNVVLKSNVEKQLQAMYLPQTHVSMMNPAFEIGATQQFMVPCTYGSMVTPQTDQVAPIFCPPYCFIASSIPPRFELVERH